MRIAITGASGLIGSALTQALAAEGHTVVAFVRHQPRHKNEAQWNPTKNEIDHEDLHKCDAVIHLAGASIAGRFTEKHKRIIRDSRIKGTELLAHTLASISHGPKILITASAIGYYGSDPTDTEFTEQSKPGKGFLAELVQDWEQACTPAKEAGLRVVHVRTGIVQSLAGGVLKLQLPLFRLGLGGRLGDGQQWVSWIALDDIVGIYRHALLHENLTGAINGTAPYPVRNVEYTKTLGTILHRPTLIPAPKFALRTLLGREGAQETALAGQRVLPVKALETGYVFQYSELKNTLNHLLITDHNASVTRTT